MARLPFELRLLCALELLLVPFELRLLFALRVPLAPSELPLRFALEARLAVVVGRVLGLLEARGAFARDVLPVLAPLEARDAFGRDVRPLLAAGRFVPVPLGFALLPALEVRPAPLLPSFEVKASTASRGA